MAEYSEKTYNTPYDDAFKTLIVKCPRLVIPVVNEVFGENYSRDEIVIQLANEHFVAGGGGEKGKIVTDSIFAICDKRYHLECQRRPDGSMLIRMFEYDAQIALGNSDVDNNVLTVRFPESAVLYLKSTQSTPKVSTIRIVTPKGDVEYDVKSMMVKDYSVEEIFKRNLFFLIPFHIFVYEMQMDKIEEDKEALLALCRHYVHILEKLEEKAKDGVISEYEKQSIVEMSRKVLSAIASKHKNIQKGVGDIMGGQVLRLEVDDIRDEGVARATLEFLASGDITAERAAEKLSCDVSDLPALFKKYGISQSAN